MIYVTAGITLSGVQLVLPALPAVRTALGLTDAQVGLVTLVYLVAAFVLGIPAGILADRIGRRRLTIIALVLFGVAGIWTALTTNLTWFLVARALQGACFGAIQPTTIALVADAVEGPAQVRGQARRYLGVASADAALPLVGAAILVWFGWRSVFGLQVVTLVVALVFARLVPDRGTARSSGTEDGYLVRLLTSLRSRGVLVLALAGVVRFLLKFGFLTYLPILTVGLGDDGRIAALALGLGSAGGAIVGVVLARYVDRVASSVVLRGSFVVGALTLVAVAWSPTLVAMSVAAVAFGIADGVMAVFQNAFLPVVSDRETRSGVIASVGSLRNLGKALGPGTVALALLFVGLQAAMTILAVLALLMSLLLAPLAAYDAKVGRAGAR